MRAHRALPICVAALAVFLTVLLEGQRPPAEDPKVETLPPQFLKAGEQTLQIDQPTLYLNVVPRAGDTRTVEQKISDLKLEPADERIQVGLAGGKMRFKVSPGVEGREYNAMVTYSCTVQTYTKRGIRWLWVNSGTETRTAKVPIGITLPKALQDIVVTPGKPHMVQMPGKTTVVKVGFGNASVASVDTTDPKRLVIKGKKVGKTKYALKYSLQGKEHTADMNIEILEREVQLPLTVNVGDLKSLVPAEMGKIAGLEGKILSLANLADPKLCKVGLEKGEIRVTGLSPGETSATAVYGVKDKERVKVDIRIRVEKPRSG